MKRLDHFRFEAIPENLSYASFAGGAWPYAGCAMFRVEVRYGGERYVITIPAYNDETALTESFLEHLLRRAVDEFRKCAQKNAQDKAEAEVKAARRRVSEDIDALVRRAQEAA